MHGGAGAAGPVALPGELIPGRLLTADVPLRQLEQESCDWLGDRGQGGHGDQAVAAACRAARQLLQPTLALPRTLLATAHRVEGDRSAAAGAGMARDQRLCRHVVTGHE